MPTSTDSTLAAQPRAQPIRVLFVEGALALGGSGTCLAETLHNLQGVAPLVQHILPEDAAKIFAAWDTVIERPWNFDMHKRAFLSEPPAPSSPPRAVLTGVSDIVRRLLPAVRRAQKLMRDRGIQLVHCNNNIASNLPAVVAAKRLGIPCIVHQRGFEPVSRLVHLLGRQATCYVCMSEVIADQLVDWGVPRERTRVIYDGIDPQTIHAPRPQGAAVTFGAVGRFVEWKGMHVLVEAALNVVAQRADARFVIVGGPSPEEPEYFHRLKKQVEDSDYSDRIVFTGERPDGADMMREMDVFVHTSTQPEPFGRVVIEAMAAGCAVVSTNHGGPLEICADNAGLLLPPGDSAALTETLLRLASSPDERTALAERGQQRVRAQFTIETTARKLESLYADCLGHTQSDPGATNGAMDAP